MPCMSMAMTLPLPSSALTRLHRHLAPAAGCRAQIHDAPAGFQEAVLVVDLDQLEGGARAVAELARLMHVRIVELALQPDLLRHGAALAGLDPHLEAVAARLLAAAWPAHAGLP